MKKFNFLTLTLSGIFLLGLLPANCLAGKSNAERKTQRPQQNTRYLPAKVDKPVEERIRIKDIHCTPCGTGQAIDPHISVRVNNIMEDIQASPHGGPVAVFIVGNHSHKQTASDPFSHFDGTVSALRPGGNGEKDDYELKASFRD